MKSNRALQLRSFHESTGAIFNEGVAPVNSHRLAPSYDILVVA